ncbi:hypothetical protein E4U54_002632 [Claviceps lovelessii]|nr:hypothetical protein E4U54_002632 [Claviceps lovelessii]
MQYSAVYLALAACTAPLVESHGKIAVATGNAGGNTTALGILGGIVPGTGPNHKTETDTTVFNARKAASDGLGRTKAHGRNSVMDVARLVAMSGPVLPQVSVRGGFISATYHIVTTPRHSHVQDGAGPISAIIDPTGTGKFSRGISAKVMTQVPGRKGYIKPNKDMKGAGGSRTRRLDKRAANVNKDFPLKVAIPAGTSCRGSVAGMSDVCLLKLANPSRAGPFGGVIAFQMVQGGGTDRGQTGK